MPDPIPAFGIFVNFLVSGMCMWRGQYDFAILHISISSFLIYLQFWKRSQAKGEE